MDWIHLQVLGEDNLRPSAQQRSRLREFSLCCHRGTRKSSRGGDSNYRRPGIRAVRVVQGTLDRKWSLGGESGRRVVIATSRMQQREGSNPSGRDQVDSLPVLARDRSSPVIIEQRPACSLLRPFLTNGGLIANAERQPPRGSVIPVTPKKFSRRTPCSTFACSAW